MTAYSKDLNKSGRTKIIGENIIVYNESNKSYYISSQSFSGSLFALSYSNNQGEVNLGSVYPNSIEDKHMNRPNAMRKHTCDYYEY